MVEPLCEGRRCIVVGSAPGVSIPDVGPDDVVIGANGGADIARKAGLRVDVLATTAHLFRREQGKPSAEVETVRSLRGLQVQSTWVDTKNGPLSDVMLQFRKNEIQTLRVEAVSPELRKQVVEAAIGEDLWVSTGVWAACLAVCSLASSVVIAGVSLGHGHHGMPWDQTPRHHVEPDRAALGLLPETVQMMGGVQ